VNAGSLLTYTLVYSNLSSVPANNVWLTDTLPVRRDGKRQRASHHYTKRQPG